MARPKQKNSQPHQRVHRAVRWRSVRAGESLVGGGRVLRYRFRELIQVTFVDFARKL